jgi:hypothetical protein
MVQDGIAVGLGRDLLLDGLSGEGLGTHGGAHRAGIVQVHAHGRVGHFGGVGRHQHVERGLAGGVGAPVGHGLAGDS